jgi:TonB-dependent starch-binding outer membrane protein SusC
MLHSVLVLLVGYGFAGPVHADRVGAPAVPHESALARGSFAAAGAGSLDIGGVGGVAVGSGALTPAITPTAGSVRSAEAVVQTGVITGQVVEAETRRPLANVQVSAGAGAGGLTGADGRFRIENVPAGEVTVRAELLGFGVVTRAVTVAAGQTATVDLELEETALGLDEIVVTGQAGQARRREVGNAIAQINVAEVAEPITTVENLIQARATGVRVSFTDASIGSGAAIRLRGNVSVSQGNQPLIYVDGVRQAGDAYRAGANTKEAAPLADINPTDIERVEIIKGAAAATLYGSEAAAGVIQIFTRRGANGEPSFLYQTDQSLSWVRPWGSDERPRLNMDPWLQTAYGQRHNLSVNGGADRFRYFVSGNFEDRDGTQVDEFENRYSLRSNVTINASPTVSFDVTSMFVHHNFETAPSGNALASIFFNVYRAPNNFVGDPGEPGALPGDTAFVRQINRLRSRSAETTNQRQNLGLTARWNPLADLSTRVTVGYDRMSQDQMEILPFGYVVEPEGAIETADWHNQSLTLDGAANYQLRLSEAFRTTLSVGGQLIRRETHSLIGSGTGLPGPGQHTLSSTAQRTVTQTGVRENTGGFFGQAMIDLRDRYFLTAGMRVDGSSAFGADFGLEVYPKVSASYVLSEEPFWPASFGDVKLRAAYGFAGRAPGAFDAVRTWSPQSFRDQTAFTPANIGNPLLGPERTGELEVGFDGAFFENRVSVDFTYYRQHTTEALFNVGQAPSLGFGGSQLQNVGELRNSGIEVGANVRILNRPGLAWDIGTNITTNHSEILDMGGVISYTLVEGQPAPVLRGAKVMNPDEFADPIIEFDQFYGPSEPTHIIGLNTTLELPRGILLTARGEYQGGNYASDFSSNLMAQRTGPGALGCDEVYRLIPHDRSYNGPGDTHPNLDQVRAIDRAMCFTRSRGDLWIFPRDFAKLREITAQAPLPFTVPGTGSTVLTASVRNLLRWVTDDFRSHDPESQGAGGQINSLTGGAITDHVPAPASFIMSLRVTF